MEISVYYKAIGKNIALRRRSLGMSQGDVCALLNWDIPQLSMVENGKENLTLKTLVRISSVLGTEPNELLKVKIKARELSVNVDLPDNSLL